MVVWHFVFLLKQSIVLYTSPFLAYIVQFCELLDFRTVDVFLQGNYVKRMTKHICDDNTDTAFNISIPSY